MKIRNNSTRNQGLVTKHPGNGALPERAVVPAGSTLNMSDKVWLKFANSAKAPIKAGILEVIQAPVSPLSEEEIREIIKDKAGIIASKEKTKAELQELAMTLEVSLEK